MDAAALFRSAEQAFLAGRIEEAHALLGELRRAVADHPAILHLVALVEKRRGRTEAAHEAFAAAMRLAPADAEIATNAGNFLLETAVPEQALQAYDRALHAEPKRPAALRGRGAALARLGREDEARTAYREAAALAPSDVRSWTALGAFEREAGEADAAAAAYDRALAIDAGAPVACHGRARVALERGEPDAPRRFAEAERRLPDDPQVALGAAEAAVADDPEDAIRRMEALTRRFPAWPEPYAALARLRWERGDRDGFAASLEAAVAAQPGNAGLWRALITAHSGVDRHEAAADAAARAQGRAGADEEFRLVEAINAGAAGDAARAAALFEALPPLPGKALAEAQFRLRQSEVERARVLLDAARAEAPDDMLAWAWTGLVWRALGDGRSGWLNRPDRLIQVRELPAEAEELEAIAAHVAGLHHAAAFPIGQSLRGGTQTRGRLFDRLDAPVRRLRDLIAGEVEAYWRSLPPADAEHPLLRHRQAAPRFAGSWSVRLTDGGFHVAHVHPRGLLSSACYLRVPALEGAGEGRLRLGAAPEGALPGVAPLVEVEPRPGRLALFPSFLFHGTAPFRSGERLTVAFDVVARA